MKIHKFDIEKRIYFFELDEMQTEFHSHPAFELIFSEKGDINLGVQNQYYSDLSLALVEPNLPHKIEFSSSEVQILMFECNIDFFKNITERYKLIAIEGVFISGDKTMLKELIKHIFIEIPNSIMPYVQDQRIKSSLSHLNHSSSDYKQLMAELKQIAHLSESRLSHLFKKEIGISIKKYYVWSKLKKAFWSVINEEKSMYQASIDFGFYDHAHLSKAFKQMLGIAPSEVYNSRMLQV